MNYTIEQYTALKAAIAQGALIVEYGDKKVEYRTLREMNQIKAEMERELFPAQVAPARRFGSFSKGIY